VDRRVASLFAEADSGNMSAREALFSALYAELHRIAARELAHGGPDGTLGPTTLLHEAYLDMSAREAQQFPDRARFMGYASRVMRGLIIDHVRRQRATKRGGLFEITSLEVEHVEAVADVRELAELSDALDALAAVDPPLAEIVDLKFFCGFSFAEIAAIRGSSERTEQREWGKARVLLHRALSPAAPAAD
jgi:RNA polymerase sigma factor (TIGR02999 family)